MTTSKGIDFPIITASKGSYFYHMSWMKYAGQSLYFGNAGTNRYDDPQKKFGTLYIADELSTALMESAFHKHRWWLLSRLAKKTGRTITQSEVERRMVRHVAIVNDDLYLADICGPGVMAKLLGLTLRELSSRDYRRTQLISRMVFESIIASPLSLNGKAFDGLRYPSRNNYPATCICLFDRSATKIDHSTDVALKQHKEWPGFYVDYGIKILPG